MPNPPEPAAIERLLIAHVEHDTAPAVVTSFTGADVLVTLYDNGTAEVALRSGHGDTQRRWSPQTPLEVAP